MREHRDCSLDVATTYFSVSAFRLLRQHLNNPAIPRKDMVAVSPALVLAFVRAPSGAQENEVFQRRSLFSQFIDATVQ